MYVDMYLFYLNVQDVLLMGGMDALLVGAKNVCVRLGRSIRFCLPCVVPSQLNINVVAIFPVRSARLEGKPYEVVGILTLDQLF